MPSITDDGGWLCGGWPAGGPGGISITELPHKPDLETIDSEEAGREGGMSFCGHWGFFEWLECSLGLPKYEVAFETFGLRKGGREGGMALCGHWLFPAWLESPFSLPK